MDENYPDVPDEADFDAVYQGGAFGGSAGVRFDRVPWDLGEPQPVLVELEASGAFSGKILDVGCGLGENALFLTERGYQVTGVDNAPNGLAQARERARERGFEIDFVDDDATTLRTLTQDFDMVLDSALYHCLPAESRADYAAALHRVTRPGAVLRLFCFADTEPAAVPMPVSQRDLRENLGEYWNITNIDPTRYASSFTKDMFERLGEQAESLAQLGIELDHTKMRTDDQGRVTLPVWSLRAERR